MGHEKNKRKADHLFRLFRKQDGKCFLCGKPVHLDGNGGKSGYPMSAVRFRIGDGFGKSGTARPRVMVHRKCADEHSDQIQASQPVAELQARAKRWTTETYTLVNF